MSLLETLKFVRGAISNKVANLEMKHYAIEGGHIRATNGVLSLGSPIDLDLAAFPSAEPLFNAIGKCEDVVSVKLTPTGRLSIKSGKFKALIPCGEYTGQHPKPTGRRVDIDGALLVEAFRQLDKFVCKDDLRPWTNGVLLKGRSAFATNNVCLVEHWIGIELPFVANIPLPAIKEVLRAKDAPEALLMDDHSVTFMYANGRWIKTQLYDTAWPELDHLLSQPCNPVPVPEDLFIGLDAVAKFGDKEHRRVFFTEEGVSSGENNGLEQATYEVEGLHPKGIYRAEMLALLQGVAETADFTKYPEPVPFFGGSIRGVILGQNA